MPAEPRQAFFYAHLINLSFIKLAWKRTFTETGLLSKEREKKKWYFVTKIVLTYCEKKMF